MCTSLALVGPQRRKSAQRHMQIDRAQVDGQPERLAQPEQAAFGSFGERHGVPLGSAYRSEQNRIGGGQAASVSAGRGSPVASTAQPPNGNSAKSKSWPDSAAHSFNTRTATRMISGPMPSPGRRTIFTLNVHGFFRRPMSIVLHAPWRRISPDSVFRIDPVTGSSGRPDLFRIVRQVGIVKRPSGPILACHSFRAIR